MKKIICTLITFIFISHIVQAYDVSLKNQLMNKRREELGLQPNQSNAALEMYSIFLDNYLYHSGATFYKTDGGGDKERLIGFYEETKGLTAGTILSKDSLTMTYSGGRGSVVLPTTTTINDNYAWDQLTFLEMPSSGSTDCINTERFTKTRNAAGQVTASTQELWLGSFFDNYSRNLYTYDSKGNVIILNHQVWYNGSWLDTDKEVTTYNSSNQKIGTINYTWWSGAWNLYTKVDYTYSAAGDETSVVNSSFLGGVWNITNRTDKTYDTHHNNLSYVYQFFKNGAIFSGYSYSNTYDANNNQLTVLKKEWNGTLWVNVFKFNNTYDSQNNITISNCFSFDTITSNWNNYTRNTYTYNTANFLLTQINSNYISGSWIGNTKTELTYSSTNKPTERVDYSNYSAPATVWEIDQDRSYLYDGFDNVSISTAISYEAGSPSLIKNQKYYYEEYAPNGINNILNDDTLSIYPNPATSQFTLTTKQDIKNGKITITDITGSIIFEKEIGNEIETIPTVNFAKGMYLVNIINNNQKTTQQKLIIK